MQDVLQNQERILVLTSRSLQDSHQLFLSPGAPRNTIAAPYLPIHDAATQALFGPIVRGIDRRIQQEPEPFANVTGEMLCEPSIDKVSSPHLDKLLEFHQESQISRRQFVRTVLAFDPNSMRHVPNARMVEQQRLGKSLN